MSEVFSSPWSWPWSLPGPTLTYLCLYMLTLAVHVVFMSYVFAGSGYLAVCALLGRGAGPVRAVLSDWLPFALGAAITAGVAPLLFVQILYQESFYTANLLLFHRFMAIVPVLIVGFYLLYLSKTRTFERWRSWARAAVSVTVFACFAFTAYAWVENHLLSLDRGAWAEMYAAERMHYPSAASLPRALFWLAFALPITALILAWQLRRPPPAANVRHLAWLFGAGLLAGVLVLAWYSAAAERPWHALGRAVAPYAYGAIAGALVQLAAWAVIWRTRTLARLILWLATAGAAVTLVCVIAVRESMRVAALPMERLAAVHERAAQSGGMALFLACLLMTIAVLAWCFRMTARALE